jgi:ATP-dependent DNA ligase
MAILTGEGSAATSTEAGFFGPKSGHTPDFQKTYWHSPIPPEFMAITSVDIANGIEGGLLVPKREGYASGNRGLWRKAKCLNREEFVVVGWTDPEGSRPHLGALLLGYYTDDGKLIYAGRVGTGMSQKVLRDLRRRVDPLARPKSALDAPPPRSTRFGSPLVLSRVHWVEPKLVAEITYLTWTGDNLLRQTVYVGLREDKPADQVRRE